MSHPRFPVALLLSLVLVLAGCGNSENKPEAKTITGEASKLMVEIADDGTQFIIRNVGGSAIDELQITTYPPPISGNILLKAYSFTKNLGSLENGGTASVKRDELKDDKGELLSNSKRRVGAIRIGGKVGGQQRGVMFAAQADRWVPSPPDQKWSIVLEPLLDTVEKPHAELNVEIGSFGVKEAPYIIENKEAYPINDLVVSAFPPTKIGNVLDPKLSFSKKLGTLEKGGTAIASPDEMKNEKGELLSNSQVEIGVIRVSGKVNGEEKERLANLSRKGN